MSILYYFYLLILCKKLELYCIEEEILGDAKKVNRKERDETKANLRRLELCAVRPQAVPAQVQSPTPVLGAIMFLILFPFLFLFLFLFIFLFVFLFLLLFLFLLFLFVHLVSFILYFWFSFFVFLLFHLFFISVFFLPFLSLNLFFFFFSWRRKFFA